MISYWDTSALVACLITEQRSGEMRTLLESTGDSPRFMSWLTFFEVEVRDFINRDHPISSEWDHLVGLFRSVSDGSYLRGAALSIFLADSAR